MSDELPPFFRVRQKFESHKIDDIDAAVQNAIDATRLASHVRPGHSVAIAVGSRGIANIATITAAIVRSLSKMNAEPFIVPAMGSHGGATAEGQIAVLATYGISDASMGCPIKSSMETVQVGTTEGGIPYYFDQVSSQADHVIVVNRIKPHTRLTGPIQSGVCKMLMIGLGKHRGALKYHQVFSQFKYQFDVIAKQIVPTIVQRMPIRLGIAIVEDAFEKTSAIEAIDPGQLLLREPDLLELAKQRMPSLPFDEADLLIVDRMGKEISGTGMDTNIVGRKANDRQAAPDEYPKLTEIYVRSLTEQTKGNASGIGIAEYCHARILDQIDYDVTRINCVTSGHVSAGAVPLPFHSDQDALQAALAQAVDPTSNGARWMRITDTLHLDEIECSGAYFQEARQREDLEIIASPRSLRFDAKGNLTATREVQD